MVITEEIASAPALVAGEWRRNGPWTERTGPYLRRVVSQAAQASPDDVTSAARYARDAAPAVARLAPAARAGILDRAARLAAERRDDLATLLALELGKPVKDGRGEIDRVADTLAVCAARGPDRRRAAARRAGAAARHTALTYRAPAGVALAITPFNAPANLLAHKLGASFAAGKHHDRQGAAAGAGAAPPWWSCCSTPGCPPRPCSCCTATATGARLCAANEVAVISFTGSAATGDAVARAAGPKRLVLELGGQRGHDRLCEDADIAAAARVCARTGYSNSGQSCISVQRVYVQRDRFGEFLDAFTAEVARLRTGDPLDDATDVGSMVDDEAAERVVRWADEAASGRRRGGAGRHPRRRHRGPDRGGAPPPRGGVVTREVFGALVAVLPYDGFGEVIETCNASRYGLQAGLFTRTSAASSPPGGSCRSAGWWSTGRPTSGSTTCRSAGSRTPGSAGSRRAG